ncbi:hypothetical protein ABTM77_20345, partial [Acinetobacter baumannii]
KEDGSFEMTGVKFGDYVLSISFQGYAPYMKRINISSGNPQVLTGNVYMRPEENDLPTVVVKDAPIKVKKDTIEFNASAFKTKPNAVAED